MSHEGAPETPESYATQRVVLAAVPGTQGKTLVALNARYRMPIGFYKGETFVHGSIATYNADTRTFSVVQEPEQGEEDDHVAAASVPRTFDEIQFANPHLYFDIQPAIDYRPRAVPLKLVDGGKCVPFKPLQVWIRRRNRHSAETGNLQAGATVLYYQLRPDADGKHADSFRIDTGGDGWKWITRQELSHLNPELEFTVPGETLQPVGNMTYPEPLQVSEGDLLPQEHAAPVQDPTATTAGSRWSLGNLLSRFRKPTT